MSEGKDFFFRALGCLVWLLIIGFVCFVGFIVYGFTCLM